MPRVAASARLRLWRVATIGTPGTASLALRDRLKTVHVPPLRCLTIAGSDSGGGAGIQADLKAFAAAGCYGMTAIVALTAQNTVGVTDVLEVPPDFVRAQLEAVFDDIGVDAAKTGMLFSAADHRDRRRLPRASIRVPLVVDPVMVASSGARLLRDDAVEALVGRLFPLATVVTPNLIGGRRRSPATARGASWPSDLHELGAPAVIVTGGHGDEPVDHLFDGREHVEIPVERHDVAATHGAGCTHSATLAALLARGCSLEEAARGAARGRRRARSRTGWSRSAPAKDRSMSSGSRLADVGELGLLAELERRGLAHADRERRRRSWRAAASSPRTRSSRASTSGSTGSPGATSASARRPSTSATSPPRGAEPGGARRHARGARSDTEVADVLELYEGLAEAGVPVIGGDTSRRRPLVLSVTALGRSERVPGRGGARPGDALVVTGPLGAAGAAFREQRYVRPPLRLGEGSTLAAHRPRDARPLGRARRRRRPHRRALGLPRSSIDLERVPLADGRDHRRPRLRRGLRAARRGPGRRAASPRSAAARRARASSCCSTASRSSCPASSTSARLVGC